MSYRFDTYPTETDLERIRAAARKAIEQTKRNHQEWHQTTGETACPWGCGDGSGIVDGEQV